MSTYTQIKKHKTHKAQTQAKYTKKHSAPLGCMNWSWQLCTWKTSNVQPKCQEPLQLLSPFHKWPRSNSVQLSRLRSVSATRRLLA